MAMPIRGILEAMEFFERIEHMGKKTPGEKASQVLGKLADVIADAPDVADLESGNYTELFVMRLEKAKRAYGKAKNALAHNNPELSIEHAERGLLHYELAAIHACTEATAFVANQTFAKTIMHGGLNLEETIEKLQDAICRIKMMIEYKNISPSKELRARLSTVVQNLQDAIEAYARNDENDPTLVSDTSIGGLIWAQYIHAALGGDALFVPKQEARTLRGLYQLALESGVASYNLVSRRIKDGRNKINSLENVLQSAIDAHFEGDTSALENFFRVGAIEANALIKAAAKAMSNDAPDQVMNEEEDAGRSTPSFKETVGEMMDLIHSHHQSPENAIASLSYLQKDASALKRAIRNEEWQKALNLVICCRAEISTLSGALHYFSSQEP